jgi:hypothetical protein
VDETLLAMTCGVSLMERLYNIAGDELPISLKIGITRGQFSHICIGKSGEYKQVFSPSVLLLLIVYTSTSSLGTV